MILRVGGQVYLADLVKLFELKSALPYRIKYTDRSATAKKQLHARWRGPFYTITPDRTCPRSHSSQVQVRETSQRSTVMRKIRKHRTDSIISVSYPHALTTPGCTRSHTHTPKTESWKRLWLSCMSLSLTTHPTMTPLSSPPTPSSAACARGHSGRPRPWRCAPRALPCTCRE